MKPIEKHILLTWLVAILVVLNIGLVAFMWFGQHPGGHWEGPGPSKFLIHELNFDKAQEQQYFELERRFSDSLNPIRDNERKMHDRFFEMLHADAPDSALVALTIDSMGQMRAQVEYFTFRHFRKVRELCNAEQQKKFDNVITEAMHRMGPHPPGRGGDRPGPPDGPPHP